VCCRYAFVAAWAIVCCAHVSADDLGAEHFDAAPLQESLDFEPLETVTETWPSNELFEESRSEVSIPDLSQAPSDAAAADGTVNAETPSSQPEAAHPESSSKLPIEEKSVRIDGAEDEPDDPTELDELDPLLNGTQLRWLMPRDGFGMTDLELSHVDHRPRFADHNRIHIAIPFAVSFVDEPQALGIPSELYSFQIETRVARPIADGFGFDVSVVPGWFSDLDAGDNNGFRVTGHGLATWSMSEEWQWALGAMYLGRDDVKLLPAGGVVWTMNPDTRLELLMPKPRITQRVWASGDWEHFLYTGFELFAGNTWAVTRPDNSYDKFTYSDSRFVVGHECRGPEHYRSVFEVGYVFSRTLEFRYSPEMLHPGGTLLLRLGTSY
jgi:hypothetical protein